eukprot:TRINITY_DN18480_c0_g1_i2.p1 TRINITY_DN18480_c0_g1~~TRINITY_DN18480_c0_g1_i2.p1  ORF type:complete len:1209 (-),score=241.95 TRINITY_DN18480_c0_g1_i2:54-3680(-)
MEGAKGSTAQQLGPDGSQKLCLDLHYNHTNPDEMPIEHLSEEWYRMSIGENCEVSPWRPNKDRLKTLHAILAICLNIGTDPPDSGKLSPCSRTQCWSDPFAMDPQKALEQIGKNLQSQYERWQSKAEFKQCLDPTLETIKHNALLVRRKAKQDRVLFHYNGHGVPRPTHNGEIWVFNKNYTQYIPLSMTELQSWLGSPVVYVLDCPAAGNVIEHMIKHNEESSNTRGSNHCIVLGASAADQNLPNHLELPADLFTSCLSTPIQIALKWYCWQQKVMMIDPELVDNLPGSFSDRKTPLGELNWIFTAVTDTIAWNVLEFKVFHELFRQDLLLASLFRNFLLAERIFSSLGSPLCSYPRLPATAHHPMWEAWDRSVDICLSRLSDAKSCRTLPASVGSSNSYFSEQLTAFEVWLEYGSESKEPPEQLPVVLQVLLSQVHRARALFLLARFLDMGSFAVNLALSVGIFPYVLKLLPSTQAPELRQVLVFIWTKIIALDQSCQQDLVRSKQHVFFIEILRSDSPRIYCAMAAFVLAMICDGYTPGQTACFNDKLVDVCIPHLQSPEPLLRQWACLCLSKLWRNNDTVRLAVATNDVHTRFQPMLADNFPEVRTAAVHALGTLLSLPGSYECFFRAKLMIGNWLLSLAYDGCTAVRREVVVALSSFLACRMREFSSVVSRVQLEEERRAKRITTGESEESSSRSHPMSGDAEDGLFRRAWYVLLALSMDPLPEIAAVAHMLVQTTLRNTQQQHHQTSSFLGEPAIATPPEPPTDLTLKKSSSMGNISLQPPASPLQKAMAAGGFVRAASMFDFGAGDAPGDAFAIQESDFFQWCRERWSRTLLEDNIAADDEARVNAKHALVREMDLNHGGAAESFASEKKPKKFSSQIAMFDNTCLWTSMLLFDSKEPVLYVADNKEIISTWDLPSGQRTNQFPTPTGGRITTLLSINAATPGTILVGTDDGVVCVWNNAHCHDQQVIQTAWTAVPDLISMGARGPGLVCDWQQESGLLLASGSVNKVKMWDVDKQLCVQDIATGTDYPVTSMASSEYGGRYLWAGCGDGVIRIFDCRKSGELKALPALDAHTGPVVCLHFPLNNPNLVISGARPGGTNDHSLACFWDPRNLKKPVHSFQTSSSNSLTAMSSHNYASVLACGFQEQQIKIFDHQGKDLNRIKYHEGYVGQRIGPVSCLAFHPYLPYLAVGAEDSFIALFKRK